MSASTLNVEQLRAARRRIHRLLDDDAVVQQAGDGPITHGDDDAPVGEPVEWHLDPVPLVIEGRSWTELELGLAQRAELLHAIHADLYGERRLLAMGLLPPEVIFSDPEYLRALVGTTQLGVFGAAFDLGVAEDGSWRVARQHSRTPVGLGYAMENRRVLARAIPDQYAETDLVRLTGFYQAMRIALAAAAPSQREDPRVVVLTPGSDAKNFFDHGVLAAQLGFPLVEGRDLVVRDGRVWLRSAESSEQVDVIFRHVRSSRIDPLELRAEGRYGAAGLAEAIRRNAVAVVNGLGSGILDSPLIMAHEAAICSELLGEPLRLPSVLSRWCGARDGLDLLDEPDAVVLPVHDQVPMPTDRDDLLAAVRAHPGNYCVQPAASWVEAPSLIGNDLVDRPVLVRTFAMRVQDSYRVMPGGLGILVEDGPDDPGVLRGQPTKDIWVVDPVMSAVPQPLPASPVLLTRLGLPESAVMVPRVLDDLHWFGRYAERAEALIRLVLAARQVAVETHLDATPGAPLTQVMHAVTKVAATTPALHADRPFEELAAIVTDRERRGSVARSLARLSRAGDGVRDQLSADVWMVLGGVERAVIDLREVRAPDAGAALLSSGEQVLAGLLALVGITSENMIRDPGWYLLEAGRGLERALQAVSLLRHALAEPATGDPLVVEAVLVAAESVVTFRRRHGGRARVDAVVDLLVADAANPHSVAYQVHRVQQALRHVPGTAHTSRPLRLIDDLTAGIDELQQAKHDAPTLAAWLRDHQERLRALGEAITRAYLTPPPDPQAQTLWRSIGHHR